MSTKSAWGILKVNFQLAIQNNMLLALGFLLTIPWVRGIANLDAVRSAECLEQSVVLIGTLLIVPLSSPEHPKEIRELVSTKKVPPKQILLMRLLMALLLLIVMTSIFAGIMLLNHCTFPYMNYVTKTVLMEIVLGGIGLLVAAPCNSVVAGYLASICIWWNFAL